MTTITLSTNANDQWCTINEDVYETTSNTLFLGHTSIGVGNAFRARDWIPFVVPLPSGKQIISATLKLVPTTSRADDVDLQVGCEDADNPSAPTTATQLLARVLTTAYTDWYLDVSTQGVELTVDVTAPVQEVLNRAAFAANNTLAILIKNVVSDSTDNRHVMASFENPTYTEPILEIVYNSFVPQTMGVI